VVWGRVGRCRWRVDGMGVAESSFVGDASTMGSKANGAMGGRCGAIAATQRWDEGWDEGWKAIAAVRINK
jgi:hypothetical protein